MSMNQPQPDDIQPETQPLGQPRTEIEHAGGASAGTGPKRLYRSADQRMFLGVCGGLAEYFNLDPTLIRIIFAVSTLLGGAGLVVYAVLALVMPAAQHADLDPRVAAQNTLDEAVSEVQKGVDLVVTKVKDLTGSRRNRQQ